MCWFLITDLTFVVIATTGLADEGEGLGRGGNARDVGPALAPELVVTVNGASRASDDVRTTRYHVAQSNEDPEYRMARDEGQRGDRDVRRRESRQWGDVRYSTHPSTVDNWA